MIRFLILLPIWIATLSSSTVANQIIDKTVIQQSVRNLSSRIDCTPNSEPRNGILTVWSVLKTDMSGLSSTDIPAHGTTDCLPSIAVMPNVPSANLELSKYLGAFAYSMVRDGTPPPAEYNPSRPYGDCSDFKTTNIDCLTRFNLQPSASPADKLLIGLSSLGPLAHEIAFYSTIAPMSDIQSGLYKFDGDKLILLWPYKFNHPSGKPHLLVTRLDGSLIHKLATAAKYLLPTFRAAYNKPFPGPLSYSCSTGGFAPQLLTISDLDPAVRIGAGEEIKLWGPAGATYESNVFVGINRDGATGVGVENSRADPIGGANKSLLDFSKAIKVSGTTVFPCYGAKFTDVLGDPAKVRFLNSKDPSQFFIGLTYLNGVLANFAGPSQTFFKTRKSADDRPEATRGKAAALDRRKPTKADEASFRLPNRNCPMLCADESPDCLLVELRDEQRYAGLRKLFSDASRPLPWEITQERLGQLFGEAARSPYRTAIGANNSQISNGGDPVTAKIDVLPGFEARMDFPIYIHGDITTSRQEVIVRFNNILATPKVSFSNPFFDRKYGGELKSARAVNERTVIETTRGCLELPHQPSSDLHFKKRTSSIANVARSRNITRLLDALRTQKTTCEIGLEVPPPNGTCRCKSCATLLCCSDPYGDPNKPGSCCSVNEWQADKHGRCNYQDHDECSCNPQEP